MTVSHRTSNAPSRRANQHFDFRRPKRRTAAGPMGMSMLRCTTSSCSDLSGRRVGTEAQSGPERSLGGVVAVAIGIDVAGSRPHGFAVVEDDGAVAQIGLVPHQEVEARVRAVARQHTDIVLGIDAPRCLRNGPREWYWKPTSGWQPRKGQAGHGRHCEAVVRALGLANPQWTPLEGGLRDDQHWMRRGIELFEALADLNPHEVFPTATRAALARRSHGPSMPVELDLVGLGVAPLSDQMDAIFAAVTAREFAAGRGCAVGGGDGLGAIILPCLVEVPDERLLRWPGPVTG